MLVIKPSQTINNKQTKQEFYSTQKKSNKF